MKMVCRTLDAIRVGLTLKTRPLVIESIACVAKKSLQAGILRTV